MDIKKVIANNIFILRNYYKLTQAEFAEKLDIHVTRGHISRIETGSHVPSAEFIKSVSTAFGVPADWLLDNNVNVSDIPSKIELNNNDIDLLLKINNLPEPVKENIISLIDSINSI
ncbi:transcriptional regulator [Clostridium sporogenes]|uniref:helix-turn-helix domain-containing protein n=1 Tax=Clostridium botulinum TaxID=1491 RepID=UPI00071759C5|nr:helix-turn-helix transcriptional regulator [Clostridium botulinum]KRU29346.1 transcriptional regulator [Clostridium sporogenes]KRU33434.1 transcriptional regulator [Clostridium sporogenes]KRU33934.1 transcriptional regulator [Clostridium sporogenes]KRU43418.1 transcriptional regulator [Clostridium sporogenes]MBZ1330994.1 helix-turn-helix transcriptional regulator [Clostridium botulinum]